jgi:hypothetical protein
MPDFSRDESLRVIALEQAVVASNNDTLEARYLARVFYEFLSAQPETPVKAPVPVEADNYARYTYWNYAGVRYRTVVGLGLETVADFWNRDEWVRSAGVTYKVLRDNHSAVKEPKP